MSKLINSLKMRCDIYRIPDDHSSQIDEYGSYNPQFSLLYSSIKCYFQYLSATGDKLPLNESGQHPKNIILGLIDKTADLKEGDRIYCVSFYPINFFISSVNPIMNGRTGNLSHYEVTCEIEETN